jgi:topoisomerase IA-like protein
MLSHETKTTIHAKDSNYVDNELKVNVSCKEREIDRNADLVCQVAELYRYELKTNKLGVFLAQGKKCSSSKHQSLWQDEVEKKDRRSARKE